MLSISPLQPGHSHYYANLAREDYYTRGGEPPGYWLGKGARALGLNQEVKPEQLHALFAGYTVGGEKLVQNAGKPNRQAALDLTFSAEKSVSVLWAFADAEAREAIVEAHERAVGAAVNYLQDECAVSRVGHGGTDTVRAGICVAAFRHETSRALDPNLHTHCLVLNVGVDAQGKTRTLRTPDFFHHKMAAGALYRAQLAYELSHRLGLDIEQRENGFFRVKGIDERTRTAFSTRRQQVEQSLEAWGLFDAKAAETATLTTRTVKGHIDRTSLRDSWVEHAGKHEIDHEAIRAISAGVTRHTSVERVSSGRTLDVAPVVERLERDQAVFAERDVVRRLSERSVDGFHSAEAIRAAVDNAVRDRSRVVRVAEDREYGLFAGAERVKREDQLFAIADRLVDRYGHTVHRLKDTNGLTDEQHAALKELVFDSGDFVTLSGMAGTGKTRLLRAARESFEAAGFRVVGATLAGKASRELQNGAGIESETFEKRRLQIEPDAPEFAERQQTPDLTPVKQIKRLKLDSKTVVVVDEASMADTNHTLFLLRQAEKAGSKVVLVGDERQLPAIEGASPFYALRQRHHGPELREIRRQEYHWMRETVRSFAEGNVTTGLALLKFNDALHVTNTKQEACEHLISKWNRSRKFDASDSLILAGTNADASRLNELAQAERAKRGELGRRRVAVGDQELRAGDRVLFSKNNRSIGVYNGDLGTVGRVRPGRFGAAPSLCVKLDAGGTVEFSLEEYSDVSLGYALTTHKAQGATVRRAFVLFDDRMLSREMAYVQVSRPSEEIQAFLADPVNEPDQFIKRLSRSVRSRTVEEIALPDDDRGHGLELTR
jgi:conjugative relaxase-like TrwC/TraI family protein